MLFLQYLCCFSWVGSFWLCLNQRRKDCERVCRSVQACLLIALLRLTRIALHSRLLLGPVPTTGGRKGQADAVPTGRQVDRCVYLGIVHWHPQQQLNIGRTTKCISASSISISLLLYDVPARSDEQVGRSIQRGNSIQRATVPSAQASKRASTHKAVSQMAAYGCGGR